MQRLTEHPSGQGCPAQYGIAYEPATERLGHTAPLNHAENRTADFPRDGNLLTAQMTHGTAHAFVTPELLADDLRFRYHVLEQLAVLLASWRDRPPLHAAAVVRNGRAVLLAGHSLAGKSTLAYACVRAGFQLLGEDVVFVGIGEQPRLWGNPWRIQLPPEAAARFAELAGVSSQVQASGKLKVAVDVAATFGEERLLLHAERAVICLLGRGCGLGSALRELGLDEINKTMCQHPNEGLDLKPLDATTLATVVENGAYLLDVGSDLDRAVALLKELTD